MKDIEFSIEHKIIKLKTESKNAEGAIKNYFKNKGFLVFRPFLYIKILREFKTEDPKKISNIFEKSLNAYMRKDYQNKYHQVGYEIFNRLISGGGFDYRIYYAKKELRPIIKSLNLISPILKDFMKKRFSEYIKGIPDFLIINKKTKEIFFVEVKDIHDSLSKEQIFMIELLKNKGFKTIVTTPLFQKTKYENIKKRDDLIIKILSLIKNKGFFGNSLNLDKHHHDDVRGSYSLRTTLYPSKYPFNSLKEAVDFIKRNKLCEYRKNREFDESFLRLTEKGEKYLRNFNRK